MKTRLSARLLSLVLVAALLIGMVPVTHAAGHESNVTITPVDNSAVSVNPLERVEELNLMDQIPDFEVVRVSIVLEKASTIKAGFSTVNIAENNSAMAYRDGLKREQEDMVSQIERATGKELDVVWNLTLAANLISANVRYGDIKAIESLPGVKCVVLETQYEAIPVEAEQVAPHMATSGVQTGSTLAWAEMAENNVELGGMGYLYNTDVSLDTVGQPGSFTNSLAVASVENDGMIGFYIQVGENMIVYNEDNREGQFTNQPFTSIAGEHEYIFLDGVGKAEDWAAVSDVLKSKIVLCSRGETNFVEKAQPAVEAGAKAVFIYNNQSGVITLDLTEYQYTNPVAALTKTQGAAIRAASTPVTDDAGNVLYLTGKMTVSDTIGMGYFGSDYYTMSDFSS